MSGIPPFPTPTELATSFVGNVYVQTIAGITTIRFQGNEARVGIGGNGRNGKLLCLDKLGVPIFSAYKGLIKAGGGGMGGNLVLNRSDDRESIQLNADTGLIKAGGAQLWGNIELREPEGKATMFVSSGGWILAGSNGYNGKILLQRKDGLDNIELNAGTGLIKAGGGGMGGNLALNRSNDRESIQLNADACSIVLKDSSGSDSIQLDGFAGDIRLVAADCAEEFDVAEGDNIDPGAVMVINDDRKLELCRKPYDKRVVGIISGAGKFRPGIVFDRKKGYVGPRATISVLGKVSCKADASYAPIEIGDLLTTSPTTGHAMNANDPHRTPGSIIGKALSPLEEGKGILDVLVTLQ